MKKKSKKGKTHIRRTWEINPRTRVKESKRKYKRDKAKEVPND